MGFYAEQVLPRVVNVVMNTRELRKVRSEVAEPLHGTVVEIGFGTGLNLPHYPKAVTSIVAIEPATLGQRLARRRLNACPAPVEFAGLDGQKLPLENASADCVLCTWTLCTIPDPAAALAEVQRVLKPGGTFHFVEHGRSPDPSVRIWQDRLNPIQQFCAGGCCLNRPIHDLVADALELTNASTDYMPGAPRFLGFTYRGVATRT